MNGSYRAAREPLQHCKLAKPSRFLQKEAGASQICVDKSKFTCLLWAEILGNDYFYAGPTVDALVLCLLSGSSRERSLRGEPWPSKPFLDLGFVKTGVLIGKPRHRMVNVVENTSLDTRWLHFWKQNTQAGTTLLSVTWQQPNSPCVH